MYRIIEYGVRVIVINWGWGWGWGGGGDYRFKQVIQVQRHQCDKRVKLMILH